MWKKEKKRNEANLNFECWESKEITKKAVKNVNNFENFGKGNTNGLSKEPNSTTNAGAKYHIFINDCNDYTDAVFQEYKRLWKEDYKNYNKNVTKWQINKAWKKHLREISKRKGEWVEITE